MDESMNEGEAAPPLWEIDALLDGEPVDRQALRSAIDDAAARDYLVDALLLRRMSRDMGPMRFSIPGTPRAAIVRRLRWAAACLIVAVSAGAGYAYGRGSRAEASNGYFEVVFDNRQAPPVPEPTRTIRFEPGVNWTAGDRSH